MTLPESRMDAYSERRGGLLIQGMNPPESNSSNRHRNCRMFDSHCSLRAHVLFSGSRTVGSSARFGYGGTD